MNNRFKFGYGPLWAMLSAGPIFCTIIFFGIFFNNLPQPTAILDNQWAMALGMLPLVIIVGALLSFVPISVGSTLLASIGVKAEFARAGLIWVLTGGAVTFLVVAPFYWKAGGFEPYSLPFISAMSLTGAASAFISRQTMQWDLPDHPTLLSQDVAKGVTEPAIDPDQRLLH